MSLQRTTVYLCGILLLLWDANAQCTNGTTSYDPTTSDPHYFNLCQNCQQTRVNCPPLTLYVQGVTTATKTDCDNAYGGCSTTRAGCVPCKYFPWLGTQGSIIAPACKKSGPLAPYCDPSYYWFCPTIYGKAELRQCPPGSGFTTYKTTGCTIWWQWNQPGPSSP
ncbi:uncharacterized protein LOC119648905 [Hermetia illucens]|nr:uncharacterized protein LOC119648905 [Hermetia illucens]